MYSETNLKTCFRSDPLQNVTNETVIQHALNNGDNNQSLDRTGRGCWFCPFIGKYRRFNPKFPQIETLLETFANTRRCECCIADTPERQEKLDKGIIAGKLRPEIRWGILRNVLNTQKQIGFELIEAEELDYIKSKLDACN